GRQHAARARRTLLRFQAPARFQVEVPSALGAPLSGRIERRGRCPRPDGRDLSHRRRRQGSDCEMRLFHLLATAGLMTCLLPLAGTAQQKPPAFTTGMIPADHIALPDGVLGASIFLISDAAGWGADEEKEASSLVEKGAPVIGIDFPRYLKSLHADRGDCLYMVSDIESLAHQV